MILAESYTSNWINSHRAKKGFEKINPPLAEKMIHALGLVEALAGSGLDFIFKGGTSLILLIAAPGRFSIDIDIITLAERKELEEALHKICSGTPFKRFQLKEERSYRTGIPKAHYALFYYSELTAREDHILLDILYEEHPYPDVREIAVKTDWLKTDDRPCPVKIPTCESIAGDKLTAFAPNTTGIPYRKGKELEIIKQVYDLGRLYQDIKDISIVREAFFRTVSKEISYRGNKCNREDVLRDIVDTAILLAKRERNSGEPHLSNFKEIQKGLLQFKAYQMTAFFRIEEAIISAAKAALLAAKIRSGSSGALEVFEPGIKKEECLVHQQDYLFLNRLPPEPLFYWNKTIRLLDGNN
jgi:hypothetical protein